MYMTVRQAAQKWNVSDSRVCKLCKEGKISGAAREKWNNYWKLIEIIQNILLRDLRGFILNLKGFILLLTEMVELDDFL